MRTTDEGYEEWLTDRVEAERVGFRPIPTAEPIRAIQNAIHGIDGPIPPPRTFLAMDPSTPVVIETIGDLPSFNPDDQPFKLPPLNSFTRFNDVWSISRNLCEAPKDTPAAEVLTLGRDRIGPEFPREELEPITKMHYNYILVPACGTMFARTGLVWKIYGDTPF